MPLQSENTGRLSRQTLAGRLFPANGHAYFNIFYLFCNFTLHGAERNQL
jgi:hypothetical protein